MTKLYPSSASESNTRRSTEENMARESCQSSSSLELSMDDMSISVGTSLDAERKLEKTVVKIYYIDVKLFEQLERSNFDSKVLSTVAKVEKKFGHL